MHTNIGAIIPPPSLVPTNLNQLEDLIQTMKDSGAICLELSGFKLILSEQMLLDEKAADRELEERLRFEKEDPTGLDYDDHGSSESPADESDSWDPNQPV